VKEISASEIYYIKLGAGGDWEQECIERDQTIRIGFREANHEDCLRGKWHKVRDVFLKSKTKGKATEFKNQIKAFYTRDAKTLWVTFFANRMWWCFAQEEVRRLRDGTKIRRCIGKWRDTDTRGERLSLDSLSGKLTQMRGFRGTICRVKEWRYVIDRINAKRPVEVQEAFAARRRMQDSLIPLIQNLTWGDFEILVDLVFVQSGWRRVNVRGKTEKSWDLDIIAPVTGEQAVVQIKARSNSKEVRGYINEFRRLKTHKRLFFVAHSFDGPMLQLKLPDSIKVIGPAELAGLVVNAGLVDWLIKKNS
jgi:hypothetical protein